MRNIPVSEFKDKASELIAAAEQGEEIVITRHGKPTVKLVAIERDFDPAERREALRLSEKLIAKMRAEGRSVSIEEAIAWKNEGRP
jgi:prevent-host-death family protein